MLIKKLLPLKEILTNQNKSRSKIPSDLFDETKSSRESRNPDIYETYWSDDQSLNIPLVIKPLNNEIDSLFADVATYYSDFSPLSAHIHVVNKEFNLTERKPVKNYSAISQRIWIALIICDTATSLADNQNRDETVSYSLCKRTLSFTLARSHFLYPDLSFEEVVKRWISLRALSKIDFSPNLTGSTIWITNLAFNKQKILSPDKQPSPILKYFSDLLNDTISLADFSKNLSTHYPGIESYLPLLSSAFDGRLFALEKIILIIKANSLGSEIDSLAIAHYCNMMLPGSLNYIKLLSKLLDEFPSVLMWYGFFTGFSENFDYSGVLNGLGQKLLRDIYRSISFEDPPTADISLDELNVLSRVSLKVSNIKPIQQRLVLVSLLPGIEVITRLPVDGELNDYRDSQMVAAELRVNELTKRDIKLQNLLHEAISILTEKSNLNKTYPNTTKTRQTYIRPKKTTKNF